jgi:hypothetical protein
MAQSPVRGQRFLPVRIARRFRQHNLIELFWSSDQIWSIDQIYGGSCRHFVHRSGGAAADEGGVAQPRFEIDKVARNDKRNCL